MNLYPLKFNSILIDKIWGGVRLKEKLNRNSSSRNIGESWDISTVNGHVSIVKNGYLAGLDLRAIITKYKDQIVGINNYNLYGNQFPLLIKFIDADDNLSVQVHPDNITAKRKHNSFGKTEMWYVINAENDASLISGFNKKISKDQFKQQISDGTLLQSLKEFPVKEGDIFFIPAGRVHAIGKGVMVAEVQQSSEITYRVYDFNRVDKNGNQRDLHIDDALESINFSDTNSGKIEYNLNNNNKNVIKNDFFTIDILKITNEIECDYSTFDSFVILMAVQGDCEIIADNQQYSLTKGETMLIPAIIKKIKITSENTKLMQIHISSK